MTVGYAAAKTIVDNPPPLEQGKMCVWGGEHLGRARDFRIPSHATSSQHKSPRAKLTKKSEAQKNTLCS